MYCNDAGTAYSWIDHVLCSAVIDGMVHNVAVMGDYVSSDHKPLAVTFNTLVHITVPKQVTHTGYDSKRDKVIDWFKVDENCIQTYKLTLDSMLSCINIPLGVYSNCDLSDCMQQETDRYYSSLMSCVMNACLACFPVKQLNPMRDYVIPGWNEIVNDKHRLARDAYIAWTVVGKPRFGLEHWLMKRTRAQFKLALRFCKQHEDTVRTNMYARSLTDKDYNKFWSDIRKSGNDRYTLHASSVRGCNGDSAITDMWQEHFKQLYNSVADSTITECCSVSRKCLLEMRG